MTKDEISGHLTKILVDMFEVPAERITPSANLYEDLKIDSIDAVDLAMQMHDLTGKRLPADDFKAVRTVQDVVDAIHKSLQESA